MAKIKEKVAKNDFFENLAKLYQGIKFFFSLFCNAVGFSKDYCVISSGYLDK